MNRTESARLLLTGACLASLVVVLAGGVRSLFCFYATGEDADLGSEFVGCDRRGSLLTVPPLLVAGALAVWKPRSVVTVTAGVALFCCVVAGLVLYLAGF